MKIPTFFILPIILAASVLAHANTQQIVPNVHWEYGWMDGNLANTIGSSAQGNPIPTGIGYTGSSFTPSDIAQAYGFNKLPSTALGAGQTITIIEAFGSDTLQGDLDTFSQAFGLTSTDLSIVYPNGQPSSSDSGWALETTLDVEWAHAMAPKARIQVVVAPDATRLWDAVDYTVKNLAPKIVSMSWGSQEFVGEKSFDAYFTNSKTTFFAATGDKAGVVNYPASSPNVTAVGGTSLYMSGGVVSLETAWSNGGGGVSEQEPLPGFQAGINNNSGRGIPDVSAVADPYTGVAVYLTQNGQGGWITAGGTSLSTPMWSALCAARASAGHTNQLLPLLYKNQGAKGPLRAITQGGSAFPSVKGYNLATGLGVPGAVAVVNLDSNSTMTIAKTEPVKSISSVQNTSVTAPLIASTITPAVTNVVAGGGILKSGNTSPFIQLFSGQNITSGIFKSDGSLVCVYSPSDQYCSNNIGRPYGTQDPYSSGFNYIGTNKVDHTIGSVSGTTATFTAYYGNSAIVSWTISLLVGNSSNGIYLNSMPASWGFSTNGPNGITFQTLNAFVMQVTNIGKDTLLGEPIDLTSGAEAISHTVLSLSGARDLDLKIEYNSQLTAWNQYAVTTNGQYYWVLYTPGDLGHWTHNFEGQAAYFTNQVSIMLSHRRWNFSQSGTNWVNSNPTAIYDTLVTNASGWVLTTKDQTSYTFSGSGLYLTQVSNPHGQVLNIDRNSSNAAQITTITEPVSGKQLNFTYSTTNSSLVSSVADSAGRSVYFQYDGASFLTNVIEANKLNKGYTYDAYGNLLTITDSQNNVLVKNSYDSNARITNQVDGRGNNTYLSYNAQTNGSGVVTSMTTTVTDRNGFISTYVFDQNNNMLSYSSPLKEVTVNAYDTNGNLLSRTDPLLHTTSFRYDSSGNAIVITNALEKVTHIGYDGRHNILTVTNEDQYAYNFSYDGNNNLLTATDPLQNQVVRTYNTNSLLISQSNPNKGVISNSYTAGMLSSQSDPAGNSTSFSYDGMGNIRTVTAPSNAITTFYFGPMRELTNIVDAMGFTNVITYDYRMRKATVTDPSGGVTSYGYDGNDNITSITNSLTYVTKFGYDNENHLTNVTDPLLYTTTRCYDNDGRLKGILNNGTGDSVGYGYDAAGNITNVTDGLQNSTILAYDACNRLKCKTDPLKRANSVKYDDAGYMLYTQDPLKRMTRFIDDAMGRQTQATDPSTAVTGQSFDADGNRSTLTNANLNATQLGFDTSDRLTNVVTPGKPATSFTYNNRNQIFSQTLPIGSTTIMGYDANVRLTTSVDPVGAIAYGYDGSGRLLTDTEVTSSATNTLTRQYDLLGRLTNFTDGSGNVIGYTYDANNNLKTLTYPDKTQVTYGYDAANRLQTVKDWSNRITTYGYDHDGRVLTITRPDGSVETNSYDAAGQVLSSQDSVGSNAIQSIGYGYNLMGSVTSEKFTPFVATVSSTNLSLSVNADNSLATINSKSVGYDLNGNMLSAIIPGSAITSLTYDARNRLTSAGGLTYGYDSENHRISVTSNSAVTSFVVNPNATLDQVLVKNVNGTKTKYVYGLGLIGEETGGSFTTYHYDHRGSTTALTDINGNVLKRFCYGPHGEPVGFNPATAPTQFLYCGRWGVATDANGLVNMRARYYLPAISRFVNQDVLLGGIVPGISMNRFAYANGDPVNGIDPFGLDQILLNDTTAVGIHFGNFKLTAGHIAKLIQNKNGGWTYVSKDGGAFGVAGKASKTFADYESLASFYSSSNAARYDRSAIIRTTSDQDASALAAMEASAASYYCVIGRSCLTATMAGDSADGLPVDSGLLVPNTYFSNFIESGDAKQIDPSTVLFNWNNPNLNQGEVVLGVNSPHQTAGNTSSCN